MLLNLILNILDLSKFISIGSHRKLKDHCCHFKLAFNGYILDRESMFMYLGVIVILLVMYHFWAEHNIEYISTKINQ